MTRRALLALPFVGPLAKAVGATAPDVPQWAQRRLWFCKNPERLVYLSDEAKKPE